MNTKVMIYFIIYSCLNQKYRLELASGGILFLFQEERMVYF